MAEKKTFPWSSLLVRDEYRYALELREQDILQLEQLEYYYVFKELGTHDSGALLRYGTVKQIQALLDLDVWKKDIPEYNEIAVYLQAALSEGIDVLEKMTASMDSELLVAFMKDRVVVYEDYKDNEAPPPRMLNAEPLPRFKTPDGYFVVEATQHEYTDEINPLILMDYLYRIDNNDALRTVFAILWEQQTPLEELAYQFRTARLADLGFPDLHDAQKLFTPANTAEYHHRDNHLSVDVPVRLPAVYVENLSGNSLFYQCVSQLENQQVLERLGQEFLYLINTFAVAESIELADSEEIARIVQETEGYLSIAMEKLWGKDIVLLTEKLSSIALFWLFRKGFGCTWELAKQAARVLAFAEINNRLDGIPQADLALLKALKQRKPRYLPPEEFVEELAQGFRSIGQIQEVQARLQLIESVVNN